MMCIRLNGDEIDPCLGPRAPRSLHHSRGEVRAHQQPVMASSGFDGEEPGTDRHVEDRPPARAGYRSRALLEHDFVKVPSQ